MQFFSAVFAAVAAFSLLSGLIGQVNAAPAAALAGSISDRAALPDHVGISNGSLTEETACDKICRQRILYYTTYAAATSGITMVMQTHNAWEWCASEENESWCPRLMNSTASTTAQKLVANSPVVNDDCDAPCLLEELSVTAQHAMYLTASWALTHVEGLNASEEDVAALNSTMMELSERPQRPLFDHDRLRQAMNTDTSVTEEDDGDDEEETSPEVTGHNDGNLTTSMPLAVVGQLLLGPLLSTPCTPLTARSPNGALCGPGASRFMGRVFDKLLRGKPANFLRRLFDISSSTEPLEFDSNTWFNRFLRSVREFRNMPRPDFTTRVMPIKPPQAWDTLAQDGNAPLDADWLEASRSQVYRTEDFEASEGRVFQRVLRNFRGEELKSKWSQKLLEDGYRPFQEIDRNGKVKKLDFPIDRKGEPRFHWMKPSEVVPVNKEDWRKMQQRWYSRNPTAGPSNPPVGNTPAGAPPAGIVDSLGQPVVPLGPTEFADVKPKKRINFNQAVEYEVFNVDMPPKQVGRLRQNLDGAADEDDGLCLLSDVLMAPQCRDDGPSHSVGPQEQATAQPSREPNRPAGEHDAPETSTAAAQTSEQADHTVTVVEHAHTTSSEEPSSTSEQSVPTTTADDYPSTTSAENARTTSSEHTHTTSHKHQEPTSTFSTSSSHSTSTSHKHHKTTSTSSSTSSESTSTSHEHHKTKSTSASSTTSHTTSTSHKHEKSTSTTSTSSSTTSEAPIPAIDVADLPEFVTTTFVTYTTSKHHHTSWWSVTETLSLTLLSPTTSMVYSTSTHKHNTRTIKLSAAEVTPTSWVKITPEAPMHTIVPPGPPHIITTTFVTYTTQKHHATWWDVTETLMESTLEPETSTMYTTSTKKHHKTKTIELGVTEVAPTTWVEIFPEFITTTIVTYSTHKHHTTSWEETETLSLATMSPTVSTLYATTTKKHKTGRFKTALTTVTPTTWVQMGDFERITKTKS